ncbi:hypothetical protein LEN26_019157 [Aphanomyces euteiches]|nr:hypothetical protein LEN26_019157 [Aphanomyces euteiches]KAH9105913.1 hypothetical protein AeMF1_018417 [Aphanomyces euteiches]KAH9194003.1 hypothetical protein AeNC1_004028 [Aphanomyces euteiches]
MPRENLVDGMAADDGETAAPLKASFVDDEDRAIGDFTLLLVEEFLKQHQFVHCIHALKLDLDQMHRTHPTADLWMRMYDRCRPVLASVRSQKSDFSTAECIVAVLLHEASEPKLAANHAAINVLISPSPMRQKGSFPKKKFSLHDAFHMAQSPLKRPSQQQTSAASKAETLAATEATSNQEPPPPPPPPKAKVRRRKRKEKKIARRTMLDNLPPPSTPDPNPREDSIHWDDLEYKRTKTTLESVERGMREMRLEATIKDKLDKTISKVVPAASLTKTPAPTATYTRELEKERYGKSKRRECGLCQMPHLSLNLPAKVSFRCIMELYAKWTYVPPDRDSAKYRAPQCYDEVPICRFCEQIVQQVTWDPASEKPQHRQNSAVAPPLRPAPASTASKYSSDPYALPPLDPDDYLSTGDENSTDDDEIEPVATHLSPDTPAKMVYKQANYLTGEKALSLHEWAVLDTSKSSIRQVMERTARMAKAQTPSR